MTITKKTTVKKKAAVKKKTTVKKKTVAKKKSAAVTKEVIHHDPFAVLENKDTDQVGVDPAEYEVMLDAVAVDKQDKEVQNPGEQESAGDQQTIKENFAAAERVEGMTEEKQDEGLENADDEVNRAIVDLGPSLTVADAESRKIEFGNMITDAVPVQLDAQDVDQVDGAGLQLLAALFKESQQKNIDVCWGKISPALLQAVNLLGLTDALKMQDITVEDDGEGTAWGLF